MAFSPAIKRIVGLSIIVILLYVVDVRELWQSLSNLTASSICYLFLVSFALIFVSALKWGLFISALGERVSTIRLFFLYLLGYFVNLLLPSYLGGDAVRSWHVGKTIGQHSAAAATLLERYTGLVAMILLALIFMGFVDIVTTEMRIAVLLIACGLAVGTVVALSPGALRFLGRIPRMQQVMKHIVKVQEALKLAAKNRPLVVKSLLLSLLFHTLTVVNTVICAYAVGWTNPPIQDLFVVLPLILVISALPVAPQGLGIQEGAFFFFLHGVGATPAQALGVSVVLRAKSYVLALLGGGVWLAMKRDGKTASISEPV